MKTEKRRGEGEESAAAPSNFKPPAAPSCVGRRQHKQKGPEAAACLPTIASLSKCRLRLLKLERVKDYLLMEEEFVASQERLRPTEEKTEEDRSKVDDLRGTPMSVRSRGAWAEWGGGARGGWDGEAVPGRDGMERRRRAGWGGGTRAGWGGEAAPSGMGPGGKETGRRSKAE